MPVTLADNSRECPTISPLPALITTEEVKQKDDDPIDRPITPNDPERDTLLVKGMNIPAFLTPQIPKVHAARQLTTFSKFTTLPVEQDFVA
ncbi:hypothetical protein FOTG_00022 [Fusarium oxysporum f. sp. vasinfectum 25433]|uniref:Uncharacterized protein n=1 Tax=Fusarium oxysporum f. sp. vasinfectum 25433 TaxID=1089449 RepID=X0NSP9_FUSOX|nr:hypothetical protein FOTG_00022 [Fusarium oxysporum f. sp. vasinfectum 25433]KAK2692113.1 hypothetical protein QWA68_008975 [Fusarium oxysporum]